MGKLNVNFSRNIARFEGAMRKRFLIKSLLYKEMFRGKGLEFDYHRKYTESDDASLIDWKASVKSNDLLIRRYIEERDLKIFFIIDVGDNMVLGSGEHLKNEIAAEIAACIAHLVILSGDSIGFDLYSEDTKVRKMFSSGIKQFYMLEKNLKDSKIYGGKPDLGKRLEVLSPYLKGASAVFIISDFLHVGEGFSDILKSFSNRYETIGIMVRDPVDLELPDLKREVVVEDISTGKQVLINPSLIRHEYQKHAFSQRKEMENIFKNSGSDLLTIHTDKDFIIPLTKFLKLRVKTGRHIIPRR